MCCTKFLLVFTNIVTFILGVAVIAFASIFISKGGQYGELLNDGIMTVPIIILIFGISVTIIGLLGCLGALRENKCMLYSYSIIVLLLLIGTFALALVILAFPGKVKNKIEDSMMNAFAKYDGDDEALTKLIDTTQTELKCCGVNGYEDWEEWYDVSQKVPMSCCVEQTKGCNYLGRSNESKMNIYKDGCLDAIVHELDEIALALGISAILLCIIMIVNVSTACVIGKRSTA